MNLLGIVGNPQSNSRTRILIEKALGICKAQQSLSKTELIDLALDDSKESFLQKVAGSQVVILGSPVYKASITGLLKTYLDYLPERALANKVTVPLMVGASLGHLLSLEYGFKPVLSELGAVVMPGLYVIDKHIDKGQVSLEPSLQEKLKIALTGALKVAAVFSEAK